MKSTVIAAALLASSNAVHLRRGDAAGVDFENLKAQVTSSETFQKKVEKECSHSGEYTERQHQECMEYRGGKIFCALLQRSKPELFQEHCSAAGPVAQPAALAQVEVTTQRVAAPEDDLAKEMTHDLEMNFNKIAPFGKEDTAKELQDHAAKTQDTLVDAVENAEVAEIKRAVFRALTRLRAATIKEFDTIARLETQAIDAYNDAHHYRAENPLAHLHEDEAPVETDKLKSFH